MRCRPFVHETLHFPFSAWNHSERYVDFPSSIFVAMESFKYCLGSLLTCSCYYNLSLASVILLKLTTKVLPLMVHPVDKKTNVRAYLKCGDRTPSFQLWILALCSTRLAACNQKISRSIGVRGQPASTVIISHCCY